MRPAPISPETRRLAALVVLIPWVMVAFVAGPMAVRAWQDARSEPWIRAAAFRPLPGCPAQAEPRTWIPRRCVDRRYHIASRPNASG